MYKYSCLTEREIKVGNGSIIENADGTVSVYMPNGPILLPKICCESLRPNYVFDIETQKCKWSNINTCDVETPIKITLNTDGVDGSLFFIEENDNCYLDINFDYLFKFNCADIVNTTNTENTNQTQINDLTNQINEQSAVCEGLSNQITVLETQINNTSYSITCVSSTNFINDWNQYPITIDMEKPFKNNGFIPFSWDWGQKPFNDNITSIPLYFEDTSTSVTYCLTEPKGLFAWSQILGNRYQSFLNGDASSYTCDDVNALIAANGSNLAPYGFDLERDYIPVIDNGYLFVCSTPFGTKTKLIEELNYLQEQAVACENELALLNEELTILVNQNNSNTCQSTTSVFENLDVSMLIDVISGNTLVTVSEIPLFSKIGTNNLYDYLKTTTNSGFYVCGVPADGNTSITACTPLIMSSFLPSNSVNNLNNTNICSTIKDNLENSLFLQTGFVDNTTNRNNFNHSLYNSVFASNWRSFSGIIDDENVLSLIRNQKIKISFKINSHCGDFCLLVDKIKLNKSCIVVTEEKITIPKSPGFELEKVHDNKKSWIKNTTFENRPFNISTNLDTNIIRETNYNVLDERLVINTKEIDLDVSIASAIETDVWCYLVDNPCLLTGYTSFCQTGNTCGDNIDFNSLMTQSLSSITSVEEFEYFLTTELIDSKSRKTLSGYPTLRALYDRYMNSSNYCGTESSKFDYLTMDKFASLVGDYWIDLVEQVIPATTIWGSAKIYNNTIFDQQKFKYKKNSLFTCINACNEPMNNLYLLNDTIYCIIKKDYLVDYYLEELNCTTPSDWTIYKNKSNSYFRTYVKCFVSTYYSMILSLENTECKNNILVLYNDWLNNLCVDFHTKKDALFTALLTSSTLNIESLYLEYIDASDKAKLASDEIMLLINNNCQLLNFNNKVGVDLITITNKDSKLSKCDGVYIKQMDAGSEFIGGILYWNYFYNRS